MDLFDRRPWLANDADGDNNDLAAPPQAQPIEMIDFFAIERERTPARRPPSPDYRDAGLEVLAINSASTSSPSPPVTFDGDKEEKREMAALQGELRRINEDNQRLTWMINKMYTLLQRTRCPPPPPPPSSSSSTPPPDALLDLGRPRNNVNDVLETSNAAAQVDGDGGLQKKRKGKEAVEDASADDRVESSGEDEDQHHGHNSNKKLKLSPPPSPERDEEAAAMKKPRVIVRFRTETANLHDVVQIDGCQWRKYGQKIPRGSPKTPRCYYRCSMAKQCPMRKHLQKRSEDEFTVDMTYQGAHNHPLPQEAVPMARATAAALEMVVSGSIPLGKGLMNTSELAAAMPPGSRAPRTAIVATMAPFPTALLDLSKRPDPDRFQAQPLAAQFPAALPDGAEPGVPPGLIQMSAELLAAALTDFLKGGGAGNGGAH